jgi:hypothetical protein
MPEQIGDRFEALPLRQRGVGIFARRKASETTL